jgi:hypothetical protein
MLPTKRSLDPAPGIFKRGPGSATFGMRRRRICPEFQAIQHRLTGNWQDMSRRCMIEIKTFVQLPCSE